MILNSANVQQVFFNCLFQDDEDTSNHIPVHSVIFKGGFHPERLTQNTDTIRQLLLQLPEQFMKSKGGGYTFLCACDNNEGVQWGEHYAIDQLLSLGLASKTAEFCISDRSMWESFPGGMPYFVVIDK